jgi:hypothetical protein
MKRVLTTSLTVIGAVTVLVLAANTVALATTGHAILAGKINTSSKLTTLSRTTSGPGLQVRTKLSGNPPFAVNGKGRVANLNADKVDGLDSTQLATNTTVYTSSDTTTVHASTAKWKLSVSPGDYTFSYSVGIVPSVLPTTVSCQMGSTGINYAFETTYVTSAAGVAGLSASATVHFATSDTAGLFCSAGGSSFTLAEEMPMQLTVTRITHATLKAAVPG